MFRVVALAAGDFLHQAVHAEARAVGGASDQGIGFQLGQSRERVGLVLAIRLPARRAAIPGSAQGSTRPGAAASRRAGSPSWSKVVCQVTATLLRVLHQARIVPGQHLVALAAPFLEIAFEAEAALGDIGAGLLQGQGQATQFFGQRPGLGGIVGQPAASGVGALQQELGGGVD